MNADVGWEGELAGHIEIVEDTTFTPSRPAREMRANASFVTAAAPYSTAKGRDATAHLSASPPPPLSAVYPASIEHFSTAHYSSKLQELRRRTSAAGSTTTPADFDTTRRLSSTADTPVRPPSLSPSTRPSPYPREPEGRDRTDHDSVRFLRDQLRQREQDVLYSVGLGQAILEDLCSLKQATGRVTPTAGVGETPATAAAVVDCRPQDKVREEAKALRALRKRFNAAAENFFKVSQSAVEAKAAALSDVAVQQKRAEAKALQKEVGRLRKERSRQDQEAAELSRYLRRLQEDINAMERERAARVEWDADELMRLAEEAAKLRVEVADVRRDSLEKDRLLEEAAELTQSLREELGAAASAKSSQAAAVQPPAQNVGDLERQLAAMASDNTDLRADKARLLQSVAAHRQQIAALSAGNEKLVQKARHAKSQAQNAKRAEEELATASRDLEAARARLQEGEEAAQAVRAQMQDLVGCATTRADRAGEAHQANPPADADEKPADRRSGAGSPENGAPSPPLQNEYLRHLRGLNAQVTALRVYIETESATADSLRTEGSYLKSKLRMAQGEATVLRSANARLEEERTSRPALEEEQQRLAAENRSLAAQLVALREDNVALRTELQQLPPTESTRTSAAAYMDLDAQSDATHEAHTLPPGGSPLLAFDSEMGSCGGFASDSGMAKPHRQGRRGVSEASSSSSGSIDVVSAGNATPRAGGLGGGGAGGGFWGSLQPADESVASTGDAPTVPAYSHAEDIAHTLREMSRSISPRRGLPAEGEHTATLRAVHIDVATSRGQLVEVRTREAHHAARDCIGELGLRRAEEWNGAACSPPRHRSPSGGSGDAESDARSSQHHRAHCDDSLKSVTEALHARLSRYTASQAADSHR